MTLRYVDPDLLDSVRETIDLDIARIRIEHQLSWDYACDLLIAELGFRLRYLTIPGIGTAGWIERRDPCTVYPEHVAWFQSAAGDVTYELQFTQWNAARPRMWSEDSLMCSPSSRWWACSAQDACLAACCYALDPDSRITYDDRRCARILPGEVIRGVQGVERLIVSAQLRMQGISASCDSSPHDLDATFYWGQVRYIGEYLESTGRKMQARASAKLQRLLEPIRPTLMERGKLSNDEARALSPQMVDPRELESSRLESSLLTPVFNAARRSERLNRLREWQH